MRTHLSAAEYQKLAAAPKRHKYRNKPVTVDGERFDSGGEYLRWQELLVRQAHGEISGLRRQVPFPLHVNGKPILIRSEGYPNGRAAKYTADFTWLENGALVVCEHKGFDTVESRLRRAIAEAIYGFTIQISGKAAYRRKRRAVA